MVALDRSISHSLEALEDSALILTTAFYLVAENYARAACGHPEFASRIEKNPHITTWARNTLLPMTILAILELAHPY